MTEYEHIPEDVINYLELPRWIIYLSLCINIFCMYVFYPLASLYYRFVVRDNEEP